MNEISVQSWPGGEPPTEARLRRIMDEEGLEPYRWSNAAGDVYNAHTHTSHKVIYVVQGSITFGLPGRGQQVTLHAGDRLNLPASIAHDAVVGPQGVVCLEGHRERTDDEGRTTKDE
jgi:quercetin dioxygenase-like cupin family protein